MEKIYWLVVGFLVIGLVFMVVTVMQNQATTDCRLDALNNMCRTYANVQGDAMNVNAGNGTFTVICDSDIPEIQVNGSNPWGMNSGQTN